jgi:hypothetical protein
MRENTHLEVDAVQTVAVAVDSLMTSTNEEHQLIRPD